MSRRIGTSVGLAALLTGCYQPLPSTKVPDAQQTVSANYVLPADCARVLSGDFHVEVGHGYQKDQISITCMAPDSSYRLYRRADAGWEGVQLHIAPADGTYKK